MHTKEFDFLVFSNFHPKNTGGIEKVSDQITHEVIKNNKNIRVCHLFGGARNKSSKLNGVQLVSIRILISKFGLHFLLLGNLKLLWYGFKTKTILFNDPYPTLWPAILILKIFNKKIIFFYHATPKIPMLILPLYKFLIDVLYTGSVAIVSSPVLKNNLPDRCNVEVIPLWLDDDIHYKKPPESLPNKFFLFIGRISSYKGIEVLAKVVPELPEVNFVIVGEGDLEHVIHDLRIRGKKNLFFINRFVSESEKNFLLRRADVLIFPSTNSGEAFGIVQLEAMRFGLPIINTDLKTGVNYVGRANYNALTTEPKDPKSLQLAIKSLVYDEELRVKLSQNSLKLYEKKFSKKLSVEKLINIINIS